MKNLLVIAGVVGLALAAYIIYEDYYRDEADEIEDAAEDAYDTMNEHIGNVERSARKAFNGKH